MAARISFITTRMLRRWRGTIMKRPMSTNRPRRRGARRATGGPGGRATPRGARVARPRRGAAGGHEPAPAAEHVEVDRGFEGDAVLGGHLQARIVDQADDPGRHAVDGDQEPGLVAADRHIDWDLGPQVADPLLLLQVDRLDDGERLRAVLGGDDFAGVDDLHDVLPPAASRRWAGSRSPAGKALPDSREISDMTRATTTRARARSSRSSWKASGSPITRTMRPTSGGRPRRSAAGERMPTGTTGAGGRRTGLSR